MNSKQRKWIGFTGLYLTSVFFIYLSFKVILFLGRFVNSMIVGNWDKITSMNQAKFSFMLTLFVLVVIFVFWIYYRMGISTNELAWEVLDGDN